MTYKNAEANPRVAFGESRVVNWKTGSASLPARTKPPEKERHALERVGHRGESEVKIRYLMKETWVSKFEQTLQQQRE
jgi:hypothetical protein